MQAVYRKTAIDRISDISQDAHRTDKKIDYIVVTRDEWDELRNSQHLSSRDYLSTETGLETVELELRHGHRGVASRYLRCFFKGCTFLGHKIVEAPIEYHPY